MPIQPVRDLLYILPLNRPERIGSIVLPDSHEPRTNQGIVKYRGPQTSGEIRVGDHVYFNGYEGDEMVFEDEGRLILLPESAIDAIDRGTPRVDNLTMTIAEFKIKLDRAIENLSLRFVGNEQAQDLLNELSFRIPEELNGVIAQEMHF